MRRSRSPVALLVLLAAAALPVPGSAAVIEQRTLHGSVAAAGGFPDGPAGGPALDLGGRQLAFDSTASNITSDPNGAVRDVFVRDLRAHTTWLASAAPNGAGADGPSDSAAIGGERVVFASDAANLAPGDTNMVRDVFAVSRGTAPVQVSVNNRGRPGNAPSSQPDVSADGRYVVFVSAASNLSPFDRNGRDDIYLRDLATNRTSLVFEPGNGHARAPAISADGRFVTFVSEADDLVPNDANGIADVFLVDRSLNSVERVSVGDNGVEQNRSMADGRPQLSDVSRHGRFVVFESDARNLVKGDRNRATDVFVRDRAFNRTRRISVDSFGRERRGSSSHPAMSAGGRLFAFVSRAGQLAGTSAGGAHVLLHDLGSSATSVVGPAGDAIQRPSLSADGNLAAFTSTPDGVAAGDANGSPDVLLQLLAPPRARWIKAPPRRTRDRSPRYAVGADDPAAVQFLCRLDRRRVPCRARGRLPRLKAGSHRFEVRAGGPGMRFQAVPLTRRVLVPRS